MYNNILITPESQYSYRKRTPRGHMMFVFKIDAFPWTSLYPEGYSGFMLGFQPKGKWGWGKFRLKRSIFQSPFSRSKILTVVLAVADCLCEKEFLGSFGNKDSMLPLGEKWKNGRGCRRERVSSVTPSIFSKLQKSRFLN